MDSQTKQNSEETRTIVHVIQKAAPGGIEQLALELMRFASPTQNIWLISLEGSKEDLIERWPRLAEFSDRLFCMNKEKGLSLTLLIELKRLIDQLKPDVVHTHHIGPLLYGGLASKLYGHVRILHTEHDAWHLENVKHRVYQALLFRLVAPTVIADADFVKNRLNRFFSGYPIQVVKNGIDSQRFIPGDRQRARICLGLSNQYTWIGTAGRLEWVKGQDILISALPYLPAHIKLVIAGSGSEESHLKNLAEKLGVADRIQFLGLIDDMPQFYQALDLFCLPSRKEGFPLSPLEAQASGIPCIVTDVGGAKEAICPATGQWVTPNDARALSKAILQVVKREKRCPREFVVQDKDIRDMALQYQELSL